MASNYYFTQDTENAILEYVAESDMHKREIIFRTRIDRAFHKLVENLIHKYKFYNYDVSYDDSKHECICHLIDKLNNFKPENGKAYSFFTIVARNHLIAKNKKNYESRKTKEDLIVIDDNRDVINEIHNYEAQTELKHFFTKYIDYCDRNLSSIFSKKRDIQIAYSVLQLFRTCDNIENFNKKALYIMIREMTDANTHDVTKVVNTMKKKFNELLLKYRDNPDIVFN
jgi:hypothetical protein